MIRLVVKKILLLSLIILTACSGSPGPINLEPVLVIQDATDITRSESVISVRIEIRGTGKLTYLKFFYGEGEAFDLESEELVPDSGIISFKIQNLKAGTTYSYYAEGGNGSAVIRSDIGRFTTEFNDFPTVSNTKVLAIGPVGVYIGFEITDDGGEELKEAGCFIKDIDRNIERRISDDEKPCHTGEYKLYFLGLEPETEYKVTPFAVNTRGEILGEPISFTTQNSIILYEPGQFSKLFGNSPVNTGQLTVSGEMNGDDFHLLRRVLDSPVLLGEDKIESRLESVNLFNVDIVEGGSPFDGSRYTEKDIISSGMFSECLGLKNIQLPFSAVSVMKDAFRNCVNLKTLTIPSNIVSVMPSSGCKSLNNIEVEEGNNEFKSLDGVLYNREMTEIIWFPLGKEGEYTIPNTISQIKENAFIETKITSLRIPDTVTIIERGAFAGSSLEEITLPETLKNVSEGMFQNCSSLKVVRFGKETEFFGDYIFDCCEIEHIYITAEFPPYVSTNCFYNKQYDIFENCVLHVPAGSKKIYQNHNVWKKFSTIEAI